MILKQFFNKLFCFVILFISISVYSQIDSDGDGIEDVFDLDDDNDGILDAQECAPIYASYPSAPLIPNGTTTTLNNITWGGVTGTLTRVHNGTIIGQIGMNIANRDFSTANVYTPLGRVLLNQH